MGRKYYVVRMAQWWNEINEESKTELAEDRAEKERFPVAEDLYYKFGLLSIGWSELSIYKNKDVVLEKYDKVYKKNGTEMDKQILKTFLEIEAGDIILVPWPNYERVRIFEATSTFMNSEMAIKDMEQHGGQYEDLLYHEQSVGFKKYFELMDLGFFIKIKPLAAGVFSDEKKSAYRKTANRVISEEWINWIDDIIGA